MVIIFTLSLIFILFTQANFASKYLKIDSFEKPIFSIGVLIVLLNYFFFNLGLSINFVFNLILLISILSIFYTLINFKNYKKSIIKLLYVILPIIILFELIYIFYGQQFYVFRGNQQDTFVYMSVGLSFFNYTHQELINLKNNNYEIINHHYLNHALNLIYYRPSVSLLIGLLKNIPSLNIIFIGFYFKIICTILTLFSILSFFNNFSSKFKINIFFSYSFILSFFYFYNFEVDAYSLILSLPFFILIIKYSLTVENELKKFNQNLVKYIFLWSCFFIIYPNGAAIAMPPLAIFIIHILIKNKFQIIIIRNILISILLFMLIILPTYKTTLLYLHQEIIVGLFHEPDYWGYYGAFLFGKDNPIRDLEVVNQIKGMLSNQYAYLQVFKEIILLNLEKNSNLFFLNILPSLFGYFHFTSNKTSDINFLLLPILFFINAMLIKRFFSNSYYLILKKDSFSTIIKYFMIYFVIFFLFLIFNKNIWSAIKLFFVISPIFYFLIIFDFSKKEVRPQITLLSIMLIFLPFYKYSSFNYGIGTIDSFPSIIHLSNKKNTNWAINTEKLYKCSDLFYDISDRSEKIFISMIFNENKKNNADKICLIMKDKNNFVLKVL